MGVPSSSTDSAMVADLVDLDRYPIADIACPEAIALVHEGRRCLAADGVFTMPGFLHGNGIAAMEEEADRLCRDGFRRLDHRNAFPPGMGEETRVSLVCSGFDQMPSGSPPHRLFLWDGLTRFVSEVLERRPYYRNADAIASCMVSEYARGDELGWHFDSNDGAVTIMLRKAGSGGAFEYIPDVRHHPDLASLIDDLVAGRSSRVRQLDVPPGTLTIFNGHRALHRVAPVRSAPSRRMLTLSYETEPGQGFSEEIHMRYFGRRQPLTPAPSRGNATG